MHLLSTLLLLLIYSFVLNTTAAKATTISKVDFEFAAIEHLVEQEVGKIVLSAVYQELGFNINISSFSGNRAQYAANSGQKAGEIMRIWSYGTENENLIRVPTPYYSLITSAFIRKSSTFNINKASDLIVHKIARIRVVKHTNNISKNMPNVSDNSSTERMLKLLHQGSVDVALTNYIDGLHVLQKLKLENEITSSKPLAKLNLYHYLHKDHQYLVSKVDQMIIQLKENGKLAEMIKSAEKIVLNQ